jgi:hypothetical protein
MLATLAGLGLLPGMELVEVQLLPLHTRTTLGARRCCDRPYSCTAEQLSASLFGTVTKPSRLRLLLLLPLLLHAALAKWLGTAAIKLSAFRTSINQNGWRGIRGKIGEYREDYWGRAVVGFLLP